MTREDQIEAANPGEKLGYRVLWESGATWADEHPKECKWSRLYEKRLKGGCGHQHNDHFYAVPKFCPNCGGRVILAEAKEDTDGR